jgi:hypothetical protein
MAISSANRGLERQPTRADGALKQKEQKNLQPCAKARMRMPSGSQLSFRLGGLLLSGDNMYRDGAVNAIDGR